MTVVFRANITAPGSKPPGDKHSPLDSLFLRRLMACAQVPIQPFAHEVRDRSAPGSRNLAKRLHLLFGQLNLHPHHDITLAPWPQSYHSPPEALCQTE
jgi:hypothetical protein